MIKVMPLETHFFPALVTLFAFTAIGERVLFSVEATLYLIQCIAWGHLEFITLFPPQYSRAWSPLTTHSLDFSRVAKPGPTLELDEIHRGPGVVRVV